MSPPSAQKKPGETAWRVRAARVKDADRLLPVCKENQLPYRQEELVALLDDPEADVLLLEERGCVLGAVCVRRQPAPHQLFLCRCREILAAEFWLSNLPMTGGRGEALFEAALRWGRRRGLSLMELHLPASMDGHDNSEQKSV